MAIPSGEVYLLSNVPLTATYEHTFDFKDRNEQFNYFIQNYLKDTIGKYTYIRKEREVLAVELSMAYTDDINYMIFRCESDERLYFAFVGNKRFVNKSTTELAFEIDVMQTYMFDYKFNASYIRQAHIDRWTAEHKPIYSKTDEQLDYGDEYSVQSAFRIEQSEWLRWALVSMKDYSALNTTYVASGGSIEPAPSPFTCFLVPVPIRGHEEHGYIPTVLDNGTADGSPRILSDYADLVKLMDTSAFGDYVQSISLLPYNPFIASEYYNDGTVNVRFKENVVLTSATFTNTAGENYTFLVINKVAYNTLKGGNTLAVDDWNVGLDMSLPTAEQWAEIKANPYTTKRDKRFESKLLCAPYRYNILTDWHSNPAIYKNEHMTTDKLEIKYSYALSYNAPFRYWVKDYKRDPEGRNNNVSSPLALEFPIISDAYYSYMLQNKNTIQANLTNSIVSAGTGIVSGAISGGGMGGVGGAIFGAVTGAVGGALNIQAQIRSENAKQKDLKAKPDTVINTNDSSFNILDNNSCLTFYRMAICCENEEIVADIFNMSGYTVNRVEIPNLRSRTRFNYIRTNGANITGSFSQTDIMRLKTIFDNGITIWHYNDVNFKPFDYTLENVERNLI